MRRVEVKSPDAAKNEKSIVDKNGKRITLNEDEVRFDYFKGTFVPKDNKKKQQIIKEMYLEPICMLIPTMNLSTNM